VAEGGLVIGTYLHGIFENENFRNAFLDYLYRRKNLSRADNSNGKGYDDLADSMGANLDMRKIWEMLGLD
jgi:adenosylcobyric acid synthase